MKFLLILEDNFDKILNLLVRFREEIAGLTILIADSETKAQLLIEELIAFEAETWTLWLDQELIPSGGTGYSLLSWCITEYHTPDHVKIITHSLDYGKKMAQLCREYTIEASQG